MGLVIICNNIPHYNTNKLFINSHVHNASLTQNPNSDCTFLSKKFNDTKIRTQNFPLTLLSAMMNIQQKCEMYLLSYSVVIWL